MKADAAGTAAGSRTAGARETKLVRLEGFEPPTYRSGICRSIHLSYRRNVRGDDNGGPKRASTDARSLWDYVLRRRAIVAPQPPLSGVASA